MISGGSFRRSILALKSDPLKLWVDQILMITVILFWHTYTRKLKLENLKMLWIFAELSRNYTELLNKLAYSALFESNALSIDEYMLRQFEKEVKERIKATRQVIAEAKESFDNQLKIQKLKDTIFGLNEQLTKAKKQDKMNLGAMQVMMRMKDCSGAHIEMKAYEDYKFLNSSYMPVVKQLESVNLQEFYFENKIVNATKDTTNMNFFDLDAWRKEGCTEQYHY